MAGGREGRGVMGRECLDVIVRGHVALMSTAFRKETTVQPAFRSQSNLESFSVAKNVCDNLQTVFTVV